jgi:hypothetical protein
MIHKTDRENLIDFQNKIRVEKLWTKAQNCFMLFFSIVCTLFYTTYQKFDFGDEPFIEISSTVAVISLIIGIYYSYKAKIFNPNDFLVPERNFKV